MCLLKAKRMEVSSVITAAEITVITVTASFSLCVASSQQVLLYIEALLTYVHLCICGSMTSSIDCS